MKNVEYYKFGDQRWEWKINYAYFLYMKFAGFVFLTYQGDHLDLNEDFEQTHVDDANAPQKAIKVHYMQIQSDNGGLHKKGCLPWSASPSLTFIVKCHIYMRKRRH